MICSPAINRGINEKSLGGEKAGAGAVGADADADLTQATRTVTFISGGLAVAIYPLIGVAALK